MEKVQTKREKILELESEIKKLGLKLSTLESERADLSRKTAEGEMTYNDYERVLYIESDYKEASAQRKQKMEEVTRLRNEEIQRLAKMSEEATRKDAEALRSNPARNNTNNSTSNNKSSEHDSSSNTKKTSDGKGFKVLLISLLAIIAAAVTIMAYNASKNKGGSGALPTNSPSATLTTNPKDVFSKISKSEILERAQYIYDNELTSDLKAYTTVEELADLIAIGLSEVPIYETGNLRGSASDAIEDSIKVYGGGIAGKELPKVYYSSRTLDDSVLDLFATKYDEVYNNIATGRNTNNVEMVISNIDKLGTMLYYDFIFTNLYSNNIDNIPAELKALALGSAIERWPIYVDSYLASNDLTRCVNVCINQDTKEIGSYNVQDIFQAVLNGISDNHKVSLSSTSEGNVEDGLMAVYFNDLVAELEYKDEHGLVLK